MRKSLKIMSIAALAAALVCSCGKKYDYPFQNPKLSVDERVENLLSLLTPEEKIGLMQNGSISIDRLGIPAYNWWNEACHGICIDSATVFPQSIALAATFDPDQQYQIYTAVSDEARAQWNTTDHHVFGVTETSGGISRTGLTFWCPNVNIFRDPRWGRGQETSGEDPYLAGVMGTQTVKGMQGDDDKYFKTHACAKHYAVHSGPEPLRHKFDVTVSQRDLWETYLPAFKALVQKGNVQEVMCAYNRYEGEPCCASDRLLQDILRNQWGYKALVVSDCGAIGNFYAPGQHETHPDAASASADGVLSGTDIECGTSYNSLSEAIEKGLISEADLDVPVRRILRSRFELGMFDPEESIPWANLNRSTISSPEHTALALKAARESIVLLKNNGVLPLSSNVKKIAVVGPNADNSSMHNGNYNGTPAKENTISIVDAIKAAAPGVEVIYEKGCELVDTYNTVNREGSFNSGKGLHAAFYNNTDMSGDPVVEKDLSEVNLSTMGEYRFADGVDRNHFSAKITGEFVADYTGDLYYSLKSADIYNFSIDGKVLASQKETLTGFAAYYKVPDTGSIKIQKGKTYKVELTYTNDSEASAYITMELNQRTPIDFASIANKVKDADVIIMVGGLTSRLEGEEMPVNLDGFNGGDRTRIELPEVQQLLLSTLDKTGKPVVLVNCTGSAVGFGNVESKYDALIQDWYGGQAAGLALADVLFGKYNPAGRLPVTFYASTSQLPAFDDYNMEGHTYRYFRGTPLYAFGYGLSYTTFSYGEATASKTEVAKGESVTLSIPVTNSGKMDGDEVVQVYVKSLDNPEAPIKSLKGFKRVNIAAGATATVEIELTGEAFEYYDETVGTLAPKAGSYKLMYGSSSRDEDLKSIDVKVI